MRPIVIGEVWRRIAGKLTLVKDTESLGGWLRPYQTAVGMKSGAEVICHTMRQWWERNADNQRYVLLKKDYSDAFNMAEPRVFLDVGRRRLPGSARLAEWCYGEDVNLIYNGRLMSSHKGQQGCPLMMPLFCAMKKEMRDPVDSRVEGIGDVDLVADFADDGVDGGDSECVLKGFEGGDGYRAGVRGKE